MHATVTWSLSTFQTSFSAKLDLTLKMLSTNQFNQFTKISKVQDLNSYFSWAQMSQFWKVKATQNVCENLTVNICLRWDYFNWFSWSLFSSSIFITKLWLKVYIHIAIFNVNLKFKLLNQWKVKSHPGRKVASCIISPSDFWYTVLPKLVRLHTTELMGFSGGLLTKRAH